MILRKAEREEIKIIFSLRKEDEHINFSPITLSQELEKKTGQIARIRKDDNLLLISKTEE